MEYFSKWRAFLKEYTIGVQPTSFVGWADDEVGERNLTIAQEVEAMIQRGMDRDTIEKSIINTYPDLGPDDVEMAYKQATGKLKREGK